MAYRDPYAGRNRQNFGEEPEFDPYYNSQPHGTYDQSGYEPYTGGYRDAPAPAAQTTGYAAKERSGFDQDEFGSAGQRKSASDLRRWRLDHQGNLWMQGGRGRCIGRFCGCTILVALLLIISIVLSLALWIRPPNITLDDVGPPANGSTIQLQSDGMQINLGVNISVDNPNYFSVNFKQIKAEIFYPINNTAIGSGYETNIVFDSHSTKNFTFPFSITYKESLDPSNKILIDLATKCGFIGGQKTNINVNYKITLGIRILFITVTPVISNQFSFACPLQEDDISKLLQGMGGSIPGLSGLLSSVKL